MKLVRMLIAAVLLMLPVIPAGVAATEQSVQYPLRSLNRSGAMGTATLTPTSDGGLRVRITATGLAPGLPHAQHIHGATSGKRFDCPTMAADTNGDGYVTTEEGLPFYGGILVSLTTRGDATSSSALALDRMPVADAQGDLTYERTIPAAAVPDAALDKLGNLHIVMHGIDVNGSGGYEVAPLGESSFAKSLGVSAIPEEATNPAACGGVRTLPVGGVAAGDGSSSGDPAATSLFVLGGGALAGAAVLFVHQRRARREH